MNRLNIAIIGSGISGLAASWLLSKRHRVTLYEAQSRPGGHANTVDVETMDGPVAVDTGFIVYNEANYPNLHALFSHLGVETEQTEMSFGLTVDQGQYEYSGSGVFGYFGQSSNWFRLRHWQLLGDISRFFRTARQRIDLYPKGVTLGAFLSRERYSPVFVHRHIIPMGAAIWSTSGPLMLGFPARSFIDFYANHGMLQFRGRPKWRTVSGGSRVYVERLIEDGGFEVQTGCGVKQIARYADYVLIRDRRGAVRPFDHVVLATHADQALKIIDDASDLERDVLGRFSYQTNQAILHRDCRWMPRRRNIWSSWNYLMNGNGCDGGLTVTYWMNRLQNLQTTTNLFVTLNPPEELNPKIVDGVFRYDHPVFNLQARTAQERLWHLQGRCRTWFCGSYFGHGFHEDGAQSGLAVAEQVGQVKRPWRVEDESARIKLAPSFAIEAAE